jgi:hypothetical protein
MTARAAPHAAGFAVAAAALLGAAALLPLDAPPLSLFACPFKAATGLPCLTCGCTHAFHYAVRGELGRAFAASPLGALLALACAGHVVLTLLGRSWPRVRIAPATARIAAVCAVAANWAFVALRGTP